MPETRLLLKDVDVPHIDEIGIYEASGGYGALRKALTSMSPDDVIQEVLASGLRGRGGAGFPTGRKWSFLPKDGRVRYLVCNADESEPGTCKDQEIIYRIPHLLIEGVLLSAYAIGTEDAFIYLRGEFKGGYKKLERAIAEARARGYIGENVLGSGKRLEITLYLGAGAYICGEETALLESLEGKRGIPRLKPPFPATHGLYGMPTVVNNVETLCAVVPVVRDGGETYKALGTEKSPGTKIFSLSGQVKYPGNYEVELGKVTLRELVYELGGGPLDGREIKGVIPGGSSVPIMAADNLDVPLDYESLQAAGTLLGSGGVIVLDSSTCIVDATLRLVDFYRHESCGKCTPCREGTMWLVQVLERIEQGTGSEADIQLLEDLATNIEGRTFCALGDASVGVLASGLKLYRDEYRAHVEQGGCPLKEVVR